MNRIRSLLFIAVIMMMSMLTACTTTNLTIVINPTEGGTVSPSGGSQNKGAPVNLVATAAKDYRFVGWEGDYSGSSPNAQLVMTGDKRLVARFVRVYSLATASSPTNGGTVSPASGIFDEGSTVSLIANPAQYYQFNGWAGDASGNADHMTISMNSNKRVEASFKRITLSVEAKAEPPSGGTINGAGTYEAGSQRTVSASANSGYRFDHWGGSVTGNSNPVSFLLDSPRNMVAYFVKVNSLSVTVSPDTGAVVTPTSGSYDAGTVVTLTTKMTKLPYAFDHWNGTDNDQVNPTKVTMDKDKTVSLSVIQLKKSDPITSSKTIWGGGSIDIPLQLNQGEWIQGDMWGPYFRGGVQDPNGKSIVNFGEIQNFTFNAEVTGHYKITLVNTNTMLNAAYSITYTIYRR